MWRDVVPGASEHRVLSRPSQRRVRGRQPGRAPGLSGRAARPGLCVGHGLNHMAGLIAALSAVAEDLVASSEEGRRVPRAGGLRWMAMPLASPFNGGRLGHVAVVGPGLGDVRGDARRCGTRTSHPEPTRSRRRTRGVCPIRLVTQRTCAESALARSGRGHVGAVLAQLQPEFQASAPARIRRLRTFPHCRRLSSIGRLVLITRVRARRFPGVPDGTGRVRFRI